MLLLAPPKEKRGRLQHFGQWLRRQRESVIVNGREMTQVEAAKRAEMSRTHWIQLENGETGTKYDTLEAIAYALSITPSDPRFDELYQRAGFVPPLPDATMPEIAPESPPERVREGKAGYLDEKHLKEAVDKAIRESGDIRLLLRYVERIEEKLNELDARGGGKE